MAEAKTEQEPSIEEILESIRQIISEDGEGDAKPATGSDLDLSAKPEAPVPASNLSLTPVAEKPLPTGPALSLTPEAQKPIDNKPYEGPLDLTDKVTPSTLDLSQADSATSSITIEMMDIPMTSNDTSSSLMSQQTANAVTDSLSKLLASNVAVESEHIGRPGKVTLEEMARDLMKPLIKTWLDQNLPGIIEKAVQKEVEKLARRVTGQ